VVSRQPRLPYPELTTNIGRPRVGHDVPVTSTISSHLLEICVPGTAAVAHDHDSQHVRDRGPVIEAWAVRKPCCAQTRGSPTAPRPSEKTNLEQGIPLVRHPRSLDRGRSLVVFSAEMLFGRSILISPCQTSSSRLSAHIVVLDAQAIPSRAPLSTHWFSAGHISLIGHPGQG
jgi:hypothetical protein